MSVVECRICNRKVACLNLGLGYFAPRSTQPSIPPGRQMSTSCGWEGKAGMAHSDRGWTCGCAGKTEIPWEHVHVIPARFCGGDHYEEAL